MPARLRSLGGLPATVCLLTVPFLCIAAMLPFVEAPTYGGLSGCCGPQTTQLVHSLFQGYDSAWVVVILLILGAATVSRVAGFYPRVAAVGSLSTAIAALAFALFELSNGGSRVLIGGWGLPNTYGTSEHLSLDAGFYLFVGGAAIAIIASTVMVAAGTQLDVRAADSCREALPAS